MLDHEVVGHGLIRPGSVALPVQLRRLSRQRPEPVVQVPAQRFLGQFGAHGQREVDGIGLDSHRLKGLSAQHPQLSPALGGDPVDGPGWQLAVLLGSQWLYQSLGCQPVQRTVERAGRHVRPQPGAVDPRIPAELVAVHRAVLSQCSEDEQAGGVHADK